MNNLELVLALLAVVTFLAALADRSKVPYPIFLVLGGGLLSLIPGLPHVELEPDSVFLLFLPPILFSAAYFTSWRDFRYNLQPIGLLAIGLVLFTTVAVAVVAHALVADLSWSAAFVLGAIVAPPDAAAATAIFRQLGVPRRVVTVLEGESLVNDASALVAYRFAVAAVVTGGFSLWSAGPRFVLTVLGGIAIGLCVGWLLIRIIPLIEDPTIEIMATLMAPVAAYLPAEALGFSGVLATVVAGLYFGRHSPGVFTPSARLRGVSIWEFVVFLINGLIFILIGFQLPAVVGHLDEWSAAELVGYAAAVVLTVVVIRFVWTFPTAYLRRYLSERIRARDPYPLGSSSRSLLGPVCAVSSPSPRPSPCRRRPTPATHSPRAI
jgi:monovalent cation/hydrogen antiporter